jgi:hypothetical protein
MVRKPRAAAPADAKRMAMLFRLQISILGGPISAEFAKRNRVIARTIEIRGDQTLEKLHESIFAAFDREEEHLYEFRVGGRHPDDPKAKRYVLPMCLRDPWGPEDAAGLDLTRTRIDSLGLKARDRLAYWFDYGDDWWHQIDVLAVEAEIPAGRLPRVVERVGESPPQYADLDE